MLPLKVFLPSHALETLLEDFLLQEDAISEDPRVEEKEQKKVYLQMD